MQEHKQDAVCGDGNSFIFRLGTWWIWSFIRYGCLLLPLSDALYVWVVNLASWDQSCVSRSKPCGHRKPQNMQILSPPCFCSEERLSYG